MLSAVPAAAADVKQLFAIDLADYPGKEGRVTGQLHSSGKPALRRPGITISSRSPRY
jgi:hypothetical protein